MLARLLSLNMLIVQKIKEKIFILNLYYLQSYIKFSAVVKEELHWQKYRIDWQVKNVHPAICFMGYKILL